MSVSRCMDEVSSSEFGGWLAYMDLSLNEHKTEDYYLAQISSMLYNANRGKGPARQIKDFLIEFRGRDFTSKEEKIAKSKQFWEFHSGKKASFKETK